MPLRRGKRGVSFAFDRLYQIRQSRQGESGFRLSGLARQDPELAVACPPDFAPDGGLADAGLALQAQHHESFTTERGQERVCLSKLTLPPE
jgi:hypothetical protein